MTITHPTTLYFPQVKISKQELADYYTVVGEAMFRLSKDHLLTLERYPGGISTTGFYQKEAPESLPRSIQRKKIINKTGGSTTYCVFNQPDVPSVLVQYGCITPHIWLSTAQKPATPDRMIFDLDPPKNKTVPWNLVLDTARALRALLLSVDLEPFIMTTGSRGLHVVVPLIEKSRFLQVREVAHNAARIIVAQDPNNRTLNAQDPARKKKLFVDYLRNSFGATAVAPYAVRARPTAPVATPLWWHELEDQNLRSNTFTLRDIPHRIATQDDPWSDFFSKNRSLF